MGKIKVICKQCGKEFTTQECWIKKGRGLFCSMDCSVIGKRYISPMLGKKHSQESIERMKINRKGKATGQDNPNYGKPVSEDRRLKQRAKMKGKYIGENNPMYGIRKYNTDNPFYNKNHRIESKIQSSCTKRGISTEEWVDFITPLNHYVRTSPRYKKACTDAMKRSEFKDEFSGVKGCRKTPIECHHKIPHNIIMKMNNIRTRDDVDACALLFDPYNLIVMLKTAHDKFHNLYGDEKNIYELTPEELKELYQ